MNENKSKSEMAKPFSIAGSILIISFLITINYVTNSSVIWFVFPATAVLWWPISVFLAKKSSIVLFSTISSFILISNLIYINLTFSPEHFWFLYTLIPFLLWPVIVSLGKRAIQIPFAFTLSMLSIIYYIVLNILLSPIYPWFIYPAFAFLWWPISAIYVKNKNQMMFSLLGTCLTCIFFIFVNKISNPNNIWAVYPIFSILWWPLSVYYFHYKKKLIRDNTYNA